MAIYGNSETPKTCKLCLNYPNPFNPTTTISYDISEEARVKIALCKTLGQQIRILVKDSKNSGKYQVTWDGKDIANNSVPSGIYFYRLEIDGKSVAARKMMLIR